MAKPIDLSNRKFGKLIAVEKSHSGKYGMVWRCKCECGAIHHASAAELSRNRVQSCGCSQIKHFQSHTKTWRIWVQMRQRCDNERNKNYLHYGKRGIYYSPQWQDFINFVADMGECPAGMSLERIDNDKGYSKENCKWATSFQQSRNKRTNKFYTYNGERLCLRDWEKKLGASKGYLTKRLKRMSFIQAITTPNRYNKAKSMPLPEPPKEEK
jgi:hypothetical protein